ncbi:MAG: hypothetical protein LBJ00_09305 [Planctomycetaceae bacterium]|jgi:hypothetical protein|nr:hypothetical protein [Planctomycetaceae bacterium]
MIKFLQGFAKVAHYAEATLKFLKLNTQTQQREAVVQGRSLPPIHRLRYNQRMLNFNE